MASIWTDTRVDNSENSHRVIKSTKSQLASGSQSVKKQAFSEIKNVIHNQQLPGGATPFKGTNAQKVDGIPSNFGATSSLCKDVLRKQHAKLNLMDTQKKMDRLQLKHTEETENKVNWYSDLDQDFRFDCLDFPLHPHMNEPEKSLEEVWSEMEILDFEKVLDNNLDKSVDENTHQGKDSFFEFDDVEDDFGSSKMISLLPPPNDSGIEELNISLPELPELELDF